MPELTSTLPALRRECLWVEHHIHAKAQLFGQASSASASMSSILEAHWPETSGDAAWHQVRQLLNETLALRSPLPKPSALSRLLGRPRLLGRLLCFYLNRVDASGLAPLTGLVDSMDAPAPELLVGAFEARLPDEHQRGLLAWVPPKLVVEMGDAVNTSVLGALEWADACETSLSSLDRDLRKARCPD